MTSVVTSHLAAGGPTNVDLVYIRTFLTCCALFCSVLSAWSSFGAGCCL